MATAAEIMNGPGAPQQIADEYEIENHYWAIVEDRKDRPVSTRLFRDIGQRLAALTSVVYGECRIGLEVDGRTLPYISYLADRDDESVLPTPTATDHPNLTDIARRSVRLQIHPVDEHLHPAWVCFDWNRRNLGRLKIYAQDAHSVTGRPLKDLLYQRLLVTPDTPPNRDFEVYLGIRNHTDAPSPVYPKQPVSDLLPTRKPKSKLGQLVRGRN